MTAPAPLKSPGNLLKHASAEDTSLILVTVMNVSYQFDIALLVISKIAYHQEIEL